uniref:Myosinlike protein putative n=1 Tax=Albugo laibachii Nc14 TaxID=890382 RepID=F0W908_9STRA|nr:myosinlike protein putative [Albugo laibachii Nc14]|eukprot:CCA17619.1 myosinlike protein putative [Albugo laibachii Nc14]
MYSSYWMPKNGRESTSLLDHDALRRDAATHKSIQSEETQLRRIDLETIMSSKAAVKYWYLHRPKTMECVHKNAVKIQCMGRSFAVRQLIKKYGVAYTVELAKADANKKHEERMAELSPEDREATEKHIAEYEERVAEARRKRKEELAIEQAQEVERLARQRLQMEAFLATQKEEMRLEAEERARKDAIQREQERIKAEKEEKERAEALVQQRLIEEAARAEEQALDMDLLRKEEEERERKGLERLEREEEERIQREEEERLEQERIQREEEERMEQERLEREEEERMEMERMIELERIEREKQEEARIEVERIAREKEAHRLRQEEERKHQEEHRRRQESQRRKLEKEKARLAALEEAERMRQEEIKAIEAKKYNAAYSKDVPVTVRNLGIGRIVDYDLQKDEYRVCLDKGQGNRTMTVPFDDVKLDEDRILSPRTQVDTPFGVGEVIGMDPHVGCYAINTEINAAEGSQVVAFVQVQDVAVYAEEVEERAIVDEDLPLPDEIGLLSASVVATRVISRTGKKFIQYQLEIKTNNYGTVYCWKRYSTFRTLCDRLHKENKIKRKDIPEIPPRQIVGNFSPRTIEERAQKLNRFLDAAVKAEHLQWGVRVDDRIAVYKRRVRKATGSRRFW